ncbi:hypothetical protein [Yoonia sp.]|uniref:hypothetical protein n=1 Tax=Yoonia sp. TaxID=2212373 RepID=UPI003975851D
MSDTISFLKKQIKENIQTYAILLALVSVWVLFSILPPRRRRGRLNAHAPACPWQGLLRGPASLAKRHATGD